MTPTPEEVAALVAELRADAELHEDLLPDRAADVIIALQARVRELDAANKRAWEAGRDAAIASLPTRLLGEGSCDQWSLGFDSGVMECRELCAALTPPGAPSAP